MSFRSIQLLALLVLSLASCSDFTYTPKSKKSKIRETPNIAIFDRIVDFRLIQKGWPSSKQDFISKDIKYYNAFEGFPYQTTVFKIIDSNNMVFYFTDHIKDIKQERQSGKTDLNRYNGRVTFWKENDKILWKLKMR